MTDFVFEATVTIPAKPQDAMFSFVDPGFAAALASTGITPDAAKDKTHCVYEGRIARLDRVEHMPMADPSTGQIVAEGLHYEWAMAGLDGASRSGASYMPTVPGNPPPPTPFPACNMEEFPVTLAIRWIVRGS